jgi:hypothetical protein
MWSFASSLAACFAIVLALEYVNPAGAFDPATASDLSRATLVFHQDAGSTQQVNRAAKSSRLPLAASRDGLPKKETINVPARILVGCDAAFSSLAWDAQKNFATRCLS